MSDGRKNNGGYRANAGRLGYNVERQLKYLFDQSFYICINALKKENKELTEKEKIKLAEEIIKKKVSQKVDLGENFENALIKLLRQ